MRILEVWHIIEAVFSALQITVHVSAAGVGGYLSSFKWSSMHCTGRQLSRVLLLSKIELVNTPS